MEFQQRAYTCGPAAVRAVLYVLGHNVLEATIRKWARTTPQDGTDEKGIIRAVQRYKHKTKEYQSESSRKSWHWLKTALGRGRPVLLCVDGWGHWVAAVGTLGGRVLVFDPEIVPGKRRKYSGLQYYNQVELVERWRYTEEDGKNYYYAISVIP